MQGNVVTAAKWLGASMILASVILVVGLHWVCNLGIIRLEASVRVALNTVETGRSPGGVSMRVDDLLKESEALRAESSDHDGFWLLDQPSHLTPFRTVSGLDEDGK